MHSAFLRQHFSETNSGHFRRDQTSPRTNTLFDDADDIQRQLDNEARDRIKCGKPDIHWPDITELSNLDLTVTTQKNVQPILWGRMFKMFPDAGGNRVIEVSPKTIWVFHIPPHYTTKLPSLGNPENYAKKSLRKAPDIHWPDITELSNLDLTVTTQKNVQPILWGRMFKMFPDAGGNRVIEDSPKTKWVFHFHPHYTTKLPSLGNPENYAKKSLRKAASESASASDFFSSDSPFQFTRNWDYMTQRNWVSNFPLCNGRSQSPVDLPVRGLLKTKGARPIYFQYYDEKPKAMMLQSDGQRAVLYGVWPRYRRPLIYGGAVHSRRYVFHSFTVHWPSEHRIAGQVYPVETQALFISAEYKNIEDALNGYPKDLQAILGVSNLYKYGNHTHQGLARMMNFSNGERCPIRNFTAQPLGFFNPTFSRYVCYQGSLTVPPCTETVIWLVRARALSVRREFIDTMEAVMGNETVARRGFSRMPQPLNDRKVFIFK